MAKFYITTPIYYVNDKPHIGHAYSTIAADVLARYHRLIGDDVFFLTGTDEHGAKVAQSAQKAKTEPGKFCDQQAAKFQLAWDSLNISNDDFIRTTEKRHEKAVINFLNKLKRAKTPLANKVIYEGEYKGLYCIDCESYVIESDLIDGQCPVHQTEPEVVSEKNWFFKLSDYGQELKSKIEKGDYDIQPEARKNEVLGLIKEGLQDIAISRQTVEWGIPVPWDKEQTIYVWIEALLNYISALGYPQNKKFKTYWPADVHLMAKDILKFHAVIWPAMLLAVEAELPKLIYAHGFFTINGQKMSKTLGNVIDPIELTERYNLDALRYFLLSEFGFGQDGDVSVEKFKNRYNTFLANGLGNVVARILTLVEKNPTKDKPLTLINEQLVKEAWENYEKAMADLQFDKAIGEIWRLLAWADGYVQENKPWELTKTEPEKLSEILYNLTEVIRHVGWFLYPIMPNTSEIILKALGVFETEEKKSFSEIKKWGGLPGLDRIKKPEVLFPRI